ncbi:CBS domain-containing protein [Natronocalculus amylovorans]|uniref:CBS domain-containing protein n=1 Tax=Natronocalculus amylovorans TaxID=2917812 RepID=A0AAE3K9U9_9EURY|nr:CBS domain-containing protein [Natronocalculus amylovorans]MCL9817945.1 CBS domain-containing protein [Natronocalculus amylovorans]
MSAPLVTIAPTATVREAAQIMREKDINALVVTTTSRAIVTSTDVLDSVANGDDVSETPVSEIMTTNVETVTPDLFMEEVAAMMINYGIKHLPVVDDDYVGMVSSTDVAAQLT